MFNHERAIAEWRLRMLTAGFKPGEVLDELESHLRDDIEEQMRSGIDAEKAFEAAVERVGEACALKVEFERAGEAGRTPENKCVRRVMVGTAWVYSVFVGACVLFRLGSFSDTNLNQQMSALGATALTVLLLASGRCIHRFLPAIPDKRMRMGVYAVVGLVVLAWLSVFYHIVMARVEFNLSQLVVAILWAWVPMGAFCGVISGLEQAATQSARSHS